MNASIQRVALLTSLGATAYLVATCPCEQMGLCKRDLFFGLTAIPFAFAVYNYIEGGESCPIGK